MTIPIPHLISNINQETGSILPKLTVDILSYTIRNEHGIIYATVGSYAEAAKWARLTVSFGEFPSVLFVVNEKNVGVSNWKVGVVRTIRESGVES